jgi:RimJ/RimL family protein N-acetyltransferase
MPGLRLPYTFDGPRETARLRIRPMTTTDVDDVHAYQSREDVARFVPYEPRSREEVAAKVDQFSKALSLAGEGDFWQLAVERRAAPGVIGDLYFTIRDADGAQAEVGWSLHPGHQGMGYMTEAATGLLDLAFGELGVHRAFARIDPRNHASAALCRRLGMRQEAHHAEDVWFKGAWGDTAVYAVLDREWAARRPRG